MTATAGTWQTFTFDGMQYELLLPYDYNPSQQYPLLLFLHGGGQEDEIPALINPWFNTPAFRSGYPAIVIAPILPNASATVTWGGYPTDGTANTAGENQALAIVQQVIATYPVNKNQVYVTGLSLGGVGTWDLMLKYNAYDGPDGRIFAAGLSLTGGEWSGVYGVNSTPSPAQVSELKNVPIWAITPASASDAWDVAMASDVPNGAYHFTFDGSVSGEDVWDTYYPLPTGAPMYNWMFSQAADDLVTGDNQTIVTGLYGEILDRAPTASELSAGAGKLADEVPEATLATALAQSNEAAADIGGFYQQILDRAAEPAEVAAWQQALASGTSLLGVEAEIATSTEAQNDINALYQQELDRPVDPSGLAAWEQALATGTSLVMVSSEIAHSVEAAGDLSGAYQAVYGTAPDSGVLLALEARLASGTSLVSLEAALGGPLIVGTVGGQSDTALPIAPFAGVTLSDPNVNQTETITVSLSSSANGVLSNLSGGTYDAATGVYAAIGTVGTVTTALDGLVFTPSADPGQTVVTTFTIVDTDTAGGRATDNATTVSDFTAPCFASGTRISTDRGEVAVEAIRVGDLVRVVLGDELAPVIWVGRRAVECARHPHPGKVWPVRVAAGAFGPGRPGRDLFLSPDHAVYIGGVLIPIRCLINGSTIGQVPVERLTYWHLELAQHNVVLAEGLPAESFLDMMDGSNFANRRGPVRLYPDFSVRMWEAYGCARLIVSGTEVLAARAMVARFVPACGTPQPWAA
jgi:hypothetical protein